MCKNYSTWKQYQIEINLIMKFSESLWYYNTWESSLNNVTILTLKNTENEDIYYCFFTVSLWPLSAT
jgi:hypothetical protein